MTNDGTIGADPCSYRPGTDHDWQPAELDIGQQSFLVNPSSHGDAMWVSFDDIERIDEIDRSNDIAELDVILADRRILGLRVNPDVLGRMLSSLEEATAGEAAATTTPAEADGASEGSATAAPGMPPPLPPMGTIPPMGTVPPVSSTHQPGPAPPPPPPPPPDTVTDPVSGPGADAADDAGVDSPFQPAPPRPATIEPDLTTTEPARTDDDAPGNFTISPRQEPQPAPAPAPPPVPTGGAHGDERRLRRPLALAGLAALLLLGAVLLLQLLGGSDEETASTEDPVATVAPTTTQPPTTAPDMTQPPATTPEQTPDELSVRVIEVQAAEQDGDGAIYADLELRNDTDEDVSNFQVVIDIAVDRDGDSVVASFAMTCDSPLPAGAQRSGTYTGDVDADAESFADCTVAGWTVDPQDATQLAVAEAISAGATADATARVLSVTGADGSGLES